MFPIDRSSEVKFYFRSRPTDQFQASLKNQNRIEEAEYYPEKVSHTFFDTCSNRGVVSLLVWTCGEQLGFKYLVG